jgi:hypothetical protein
MLCYLLAEHQWVQKRLRYRVIRKPVLTAAGPNRIITILTTRAAGYLFHLGVRVGLIRRPRKEDSFARNICSSRAVKHTTYLHLLNTLTVCEPRYIITNVAHLIVDLRNYVVFY